MEMEQIPDKPIRIYQCENSADGILSAVYEAGISGYGHRYIRIEPQSIHAQPNYQLFAEYREVVTDKEHAQCVLRQIYRLISPEAYEMVLKALASAATERSDAVYQFVTYGFSMGAKVTGAMQLPCVQELFALARRVANEAHWFHEILRFQEVSVEPSVLLAVIEPEAAVLPMVTPHFADRLNTERFVIYDKTHGQAAFYFPGQEWFIRLLEEEECRQLERMWEQEEQYVDLWKTFFEHICIEERRNPKLQRNMAPLKYRKHMTEFQ